MTIGFTKQITSEKTNSKIILQFLKGNRLGLMHIIIYIYKQANHCHNKFNVKI